MGRRISGYTTGESTLMGRHKVTAVAGQSHYLLMATQSPLVHVKTMVVEIDQVALGSTTGMALHGAS